MERVDCYHCLFKINAIIVRKHAATVIVLGGQPGPARKKFTMIWKMSLFQKK
jgi:hypothetical protein